MKRGSLVIVSGFSGSGKGTIMKSLLGKYDNYALSISATTRDPRPGEENGREYFFVTTDRFEEMIAHDELIEYARYVSNYYGTPKDYVEQKRNEGKDVILEIEIQGAMNVKKQFPDAVMIFVVPPSAEELKNRLVNRQTETEEVIRKRLARATEESSYMDSYEYLIVNDDLDRCVEELHHLIQSTHCRVSQNAEMIGRLKEELKKFEH